MGAKGGDCNGCDKSTCKYCGNHRDNDNCGDYNGQWCFACEAQYHEGGYGTLVHGKLLLRKGDKLKVLVGGKGQDCKALPRFSLPNNLPDGRDYLEATTGAGGGGATSVIFQHDDGREEPFVVVAGGGGSGFFFNGEDGEVEPNGGFGWGGNNGEGGGLGPVPGTGYNEIPATPQFGGAGGAGVYGNGVSRYAEFSKSDGLKKYDAGEVWEYVWAEGGGSLLKGGRGGYSRREGFGFEEEYKYIEAQSGSAGGYGGGGQGGSGEYSLLCFGSIVMKQA